MRIAVLGAGAIGGAVGALLARAGQDVTLVGRPEVIEVVRQAGLQVDGSLGAFTAHVAAATQLDFTPDLVLLTVKTQDVEGVVRAHLDHLKDVPLVTMQNGVRSDSLVAGLLPRDQLLSSVVQVTTTYLTPGHVTIAELGQLVLGRPTGPHDALVDRVAAILRLAVPTSVSDDLEGAHWLKLLMNLNNAVPAMTNLSLHEVTRDPFLRRLSVTLMREGSAVVEAAGIPLAPLDGVSPGTVRLITRLPTPIAGRLFASRAGRLGDGVPILGSTLQSLRRGRPSEIEFLNGEIVLRGRQVGVPTPANAKAVELVHDIERTGRFYRPEALRDLFAAASAG